MAEVYVHQEYPKILYHPSGKTARVESKEEEQKLGADWVDSPAKYGYETCPAAPVIEDEGYAIPGYVGAKSPEAAPVPPAEKATVIPPEAALEMKKLEDEAAAVRAKAEEEKAKASAEPPRGAIRRP